jgi:hypothetical protein
LNFAVEPFDQTLEQYGADLASVRFFNTDGPDLLPYATLVAARKPKGSVLAALAGVYEWQNNPLIFLVEADRVESEQDLNRIRRLVAMRGDAPYLGVVRPGQLTVYHVSLDRDAVAKALIPLELGDERATFAHLCNNRPGGRSTFPAFDLEGCPYTIAWLHR